MLLSARDAARLLQISERQLYRWVDEDEIPFQRIRDQVRFNRSELLEWATVKRLPVDLEAFAANDDPDEPAPSLVDAIRAGGVHVDVPSSARDVALRAVVERTPVPATLDRELLVETLLAREASSSTAIGEGIAIPHVRHPAVASGAPPTVSVSYLASPLELGAPDRRPVHTIFMIISPTVRAHLQLLARLSRALHDPAVRAAIEQRASAETLVTVLEHLERRGEPSAAESAREQGE